MIRCTDTGATPGLMAVDTAGTGVMGVARVKAKCRGLTARITKVTGMMIRSKAKVPWFTSPKPSTLAPSTPTNVTEPEQ